MSAYAMKTIILKYFVPIFENIRLPHMKILDPPMLIDTCVALINLMDNVADIKIYSSAYRSANAYRYMRHIN